MKRFIKNIILFGAILLGFLIVCDAITTYAFHQKRTRKYGIWNEIFHDEINADVLIMGNSRAWRQYSTAILDSVLGCNLYNVGIDGSCFNRQYIRYKMYRNYQLSKPRCIIQDVGCTTTGRTYGYDREQFMPYLMYSDFRACVKKEEPMSFGELYIPMYRYYVNNFYDEYVKFDFEVYKGYAPEIGEWEGKSEDVKPFSADVDETTMEMFDRYVNEVLNDGIQLVFVFSPVLYVEVEKKILNFNEINQLFYDISEKYEIPILDYTTDKISYDPACFYNATHLNRRGAEMFSDKLAHDLDTLGIR